MTDTDLARMDDDGFNSKHLHRLAKKQFVRAAKAYCYDMSNPYSEKAGIKLKLHTAMIDAYIELLRT